MAIVHMQKVAVIAHHSLREEVIQYLHERGVMQVNQTENGVQPDHTDVNFRIAELQFAIQTLKDIAPKDIAAEAQKRASPADIIRAAQHTDVRGIVDALHRLEEEDTQAERSIQELQAMADLLSPWDNLPLALDSAAESRKTVRLLGTVPDARIDELRTTLSQKTPLSFIEVVSMSDSLAHVVAVIWKTEQRSFEETATQFGWTTVQLPLLEGMAKGIHANALEELNTLNVAKEKRMKEREALALMLPNLVKTEMYMNWLTEKQGVRESLSATKNTITLLGWIPSKDIQGLEESLHKLSPAIALLKVQPNENEETPVLLRHNKLIAPFVSVTTLYGLPRPTDMDPTTALSPFFILFFALCLTDAGYGLVLFVIFSIVLWKTKKTVEEAPLLWLLWLSGIATFFVSIPFGGWFGLTPDQVPEYLTKQTPEGRFFMGQIWNLSSQSGITFLQNLALALGLTHLFFGMFLSGWHKWIHGQKAAAFWQDFTSHILFAAIAFYFAAPLFEATRELQTIALYLLLVAVALSIWGKGHGSVWYLRPIFGVLGLVNFAIGMLSNSLSYLRLLALGLVTGAIALAVNQVALEMGKLFPIWIGLPVIVIIFLLGHLVSIALNTLGSFIHSGRLQFIEFFSQFFEGGGKPFVPFRRSSH